MLIALLPLLVVIRWGYIDDVGSNDSFTGRGKLRLSVKINGITTDKSFEIENPQALNPYNPDYLSNIVEYSTLIIANNR